MFAQGGQDTTFESNFSTNRAGCTAAELNYIPVKKRSGDKCTFLEILNSGLTKEYFHSEC